MGSESSTLFAMYPRASAGPDKLVRRAAWLALRDAFERVHREFRRWFRPGWGRSLTHISQFWHIRDRHQRHHHEQDERHDGAVELGDGAVEAERGDKEVQ